MRQRSRSTVAPQRLIRRTRQHITAGTTRCYHWPTCQRNQRKRHFLTKPKQSLVSRSAEGDFVKGRKLSQAASMMWMPKPGRKGAFRVFAGRYLSLTCASRDRYHVPKSTQEVFEFRAPKSGRRRQS